MLPEMFTETWNWLLDLSKVQLILLGGAIALLVALSKVLRLLFLALVLLFFLVVVFAAVADAVCRVSVSRTPAGRACCSSRLKCERRC